MSKLSKRSTHYNPANIHYRVCPSTLYNFASDVSEQSINHDFSRTPWNASIALFRPLGITPNFFLPKESEMSQTANNAQQSLPQQPAVFFVQFQPTFYVFNTPPSPAANETLQQPEQDQTQPSMPQPMMADFAHIMQHMLATMPFVVPQQFQFTFNAMPGGGFGEDESNLPRARPACSKAVSELRYVAPTDGNREEPCPVCTDALFDCDENDEKKELETTPLVMEMPCGHHYHAECLTQWLKRSNQCPMCRYELDTDDEIYNQKVAHVRNQERQKTGPPT